MGGVRDGVVFGVLGPVLVGTAGGPVSIPEARCRAVLAALLIDVGRTVSVSRLATLVWGQDPPPSMRKAVQVYISRLRRNLAELDGVAIFTDPDGYRLQCPPDRVDLHVFRRTVAEARRHQAPAKRAELLHEAVAQWRGAPFADTGTGGLREWVAPGLEEERLTALEDLFEARLATGEHAQALGPLASLAGEHSLRERLVGLHMVALHQGGQTAAAADAFRVLRRRMRSEIGLEPGVPLVALHRQILTGSPSPAEPPAGADPFAALFPGSPGRLLAQADGHLRGGDYDRALALYHLVRALARDRGDTAAYERATSGLTAANRCCGQRAS